MKDCYRVKMNDQYVYFSSLYQAFKAIAFHRKACEIDVKLDGVWKSGGIRNVNVGWV